MAKATKTTKTKNTTKTKAETEKKENHGQKDGRPRIKFDWGRFNILCQYRLSLSDCAELMTCSEDTVERRVRAKYGITFADYRMKKVAHVRAMLISKALDAAKAGDKTLLIFSLKNYCGWSDNPDQTEYIDDETKYPAPESA